MEPLGIVNYPAFLATGTLWGLLLAFAFSSLRSRLMENLQSIQLQALFQRIAAAVFIALGVSLAFSVLYCKYLQIA